MRVRTSTTMTTLLRLLRFRSAAVFRCAQSWRKHAAAGQGMLTKTENGSCPSSKPIKGDPNAMKDGAACGSISYRLAKHIIVSEYHPLHARQYSHEASLMAAGRPRQLSAHGVRYRAGLSVASDPCPQREKLSICLLSTSKSKVRSSVDPRVEDSPADWVERFQTKFRNRSPARDAIRLVCSDHHLTLRVWQKINSLSILVVEWRAVLTGSNARIVKKL